MTELGLGLDSLSDGSVMPFCFGSALVFEREAVFVIVKAHRHDGVIVLQVSDAREFVPRPDVRLRRPSSECAGGASTPGGPHPMLYVSTGRIAPVP